jgi:hypothetical protein
MEPLLTKPERVSYTPSLLALMAMGAVIFAPTSDVAATPRRASVAEPELFVPPAARYLVQVGAFAPSSSEPSALCDLARNTLVGRLAREETVFLDASTSDPATVRRTLRQHQLQGFIFDGRVRIMRGNAANRVEVSLLVQTHPEREYRFEASVSVTLSGVTSAQQSGEIGDATRRAAALVARRALSQLGR